ncbi:MAG TPA: hypothetical protein VGR14_14120 [Verrucomicrobiae bacterium]|jgi:hypothetical protein|nr:hypothetical protein [Verrucomicrobiae bacterium]
MRTVTRKHLSVVDGLARFAQVTIAEFAQEAADKPGEQPQLILNDHVIERHSKEENALIDAAMNALRETEQRLGWHGLPLRLVKVESSYVDVHPDAVRMASIAAATALIDKA